MLADEPAPPPHVMSIYRLSMLTAAGAPANQVENQVNGMVAAWNAELAHDRAGLRARLDELAATLRSGLHEAEGPDGAAPRAAAFRAALGAVSRAQAGMAQAEMS